MSCARCAEARDVVCRLVMAMPRCCNCGDTGTLVAPVTRHVLCEPCWLATPASADEPERDMRPAIAAAYDFLRRPEGLPPTTTP